MIFPEAKQFQVNPNEEYFVNGSPIKHSVTPLQNITNGQTALNTNGLPAAINRALTGFGSASQATTSQRINHQTTKKREASWRKTIPELVFKNNRLIPNRSVS